MHAIDSGSQRRGASGDAVPSAAGRRAAACEHEHAVARSGLGRQLREQRDVVVRAQARLHDQRLDVGVREDLPQLARGDEGRDRHQRRAAAPHAERGRQPGRVSCRRAGRRALPAPQPAPRQALRPGVGGARRARRTISAPCSPTTARPLAVAPRPVAQQRREIAALRPRCSRPSAAARTLRRSSPLGSSVNGTDTDQVSPKVQKLSAWWPDSPPATAMRNCSGVAHSGTTPFST